MARSRARVSREEVEEGDGRQGLFRCGRKRGVMVELGARQWSRKRDVKCLGQPRSQRPRQGQRNCPMTASGCVGSPSKRFACQAARMPDDQGGPLGDVADSGGAVLLFRTSVPRVCFSRAFCSPIPDRSRASAAACYVRATVCGNRQDMVRGSVYTASSVVRYVIIVYCEWQAL